MKFKLVERIVRPRHTPGVDWGGPRWVVARRGDKELWWHASHKVWTGRLSGYQHGECYLEAVSGNVDGYPGKCGTIHRGGRLSKRMLLEKAEAIDKFFSCKVAAKLDPKKTLIVEG